MVGKRQEVKTTRDRGGERTLARGVCELELELEKEPRRVSPDRHARCPGSLFGCTFGK